ncbi:MAG: TetR family transcriptional regulator [Pseudonocardiaceae bacterium]|nr:TetR family transcriptional regulator [Pseudonocardiaceae bacterium]
MAPRTYGDRTLSPNQEFRRTEILDATTRLLRTRGVAACTVRAIAKEAGTSNGVIHYYFTDAQELTDLGFLRLAQDYYEHIRGQAAQIPDPVEALWHTVVTYVTPWGVHTSMPLLWCEYYVAAMRTKRPDGVVATQQAMTDLFAYALERVSPTLVRHAAALTRHVTGAVLSQPQVPVDLGDLVGEIARIIEVPAPDTTDFSCREDDCSFHSSDPVRRQRPA